MTNQQVYVAIRFPDDQVIVLGFLTQGRTRELPSGAAWLNDGSGWWMRPPTDENIEAEIAKALPNIVLDPSRGFNGQKHVGYTIHAEPPFPGRTPEELARRRYRKAGRHNGAACYHDMEVAKECHREWLRNKRAPELMTLDTQWMKAVAAGDGTDAAIDQQRQALRDVTDDPRIDAAQTLDDLVAVTLDEARDAAATRLVEAASALQAAKAS